MSSKSIPFTPHDYDGTSPSTAQLKKCILPAVQHTKQQSCRTFASIISMLCLKYRKKKNTDSSFINSQPDSRTDSSDRLPSQFDSTDGRTRELFLFTFFFSPPTTIVSVSFHLSRGLDSSLLTRYDGWKNFYCKIFAWVCVCLGRNCKLPPAAGPGGREIEETSNSVSGFCRVGPVLFCIQVFPFILCRNSHSTSRSI